MTSLPQRRCQGCGVAFLPARRDQVFHSRACKEGARQARKRASGPGLSAREPQGAAGRTPPPPRRSEPLFVPDLIDPGSGRVVEYVNAEVKRWNAGERDEPLDLILKAAKDRIGRAGR